MHPCALRGVRLGRVRHLPRVDQGRRARDAAVRTPVQEEVPAGLARAQPALPSLPRARTCTVRTVVTRCEQ